MTKNEKARWLVDNEYSPNMRDARKLIDLDDMIKMAWTEKQLRVWCDLLASGARIEKAHTLCFDQSDRKENLEVLRSFEEGK